MDKPVTSVATSLGWQTSISRTSVGSLSCAAFSDQQSRLVNGLEDVIRAVRALDLPRFRFEDLVRQRDLGEGETYRVEECRLRNNVVAVKHLKLDNEGSEHSKFGSRLRAVVLEIQIMRHPPLKSHPNLPSVFGYGWKTLTDSILPFIVVEHAALGTFREYLKNYGLRPHSHTGKIEVLLGDILSGLSALHSCGVVHGDVKLDNVLILPFSDSPAEATAKITDFGHALVLNNVSGSNSTGQIRYYGTTIYNAPEVRVQDQFPIDRPDLFKCDIWAFGLLVWEACIGGEEYLQHINKSEPPAFTDNEDCISYKDLCELAKRSLPGSKHSLGAAMFFRVTLNKTLQEDPCRRASSVRDLPIFTRWNTGGLDGLPANLALHLETPVPTYEMFRLDNGGDLSWTHQKQMFEGLQTTHSGKLAKEHSAITWQLSMAFRLGFGTAKNTLTAYHFAKLAYADNHPVALVFSDLFAPTPSLTGQYADCIAELLRSGMMCNNWPPILKACLNGNAPATLGLIRRGADPNTCTMDGCGLLHWLFMISASNAFGEVVDVLKRHRKRLFLDEACTMARNVHYQWPLQLFGTPLAFAISVNSETSVRALLLLGANPLALAYGPGSFPESDPRSSWTAFHIAVKYHCHQILGVMLESIGPGREYHLRNSYSLGSALTYSTPLERIAIHGSNARMNLSLTIDFVRKWQRLDAIRPDGMTALIQAIDFEDEEVVSGLLQAEPELASSPSRSPFDQATFDFPIHFAVQIAARRDTPEALEIIKLLEAQSRDLDASIVPSRDHLGRTLLHLAVTGESDRTARWILQKRVGLLEVEDNRGQTPLHYCTSRVSYDLLLKENRANVNHTDRQGITSLHRSCDLGNHELVQAILEFDPHLDLANNIFGTPLHCAVRKGSLECVLLLLDAGAPLEAIDRNGNTAIHVAARLDRHVILRLLLNRGAIPDRKNKFGHNAMAIALTAGRFGSKGVLSILQGQQVPNSTKEILLAGTLDLQDLPQSITDTEQTQKEAHPNLDFEWLQESLLQLPQAQDYKFQSDREGTGVNFAAPNSYVDREERLRRSQDLASVINDALKSADGNRYEIGVAMVASIISIYYDETTWLPPAADFFHENMLVTTNALSQGYAWMENAAAECIAEVIFRTKPGGVYPGREASDLKSLILSELIISVNSDYEIGTGSGGSTNIDAGLPRDAVDVMEQYNKWLESKQAAALTKIDSEEDMAGADTLLTKLSKDHGNSNSDSLHDPDSGSHIGRSERDSDDNNSLPRTRVSFWRRVTAEFGRASKRSSEGGGSHRSFQLPSSRSRQTWGHYSL